MAVTMTGQAGTPTAAGPEAWQATRTQTNIATQFLGDENDYLAAKSDAGNIGRHVGGDQHELFVSCDAAAARSLADHDRHEARDVRLRLRVVTGVTNDHDHLCAVRVRHVGPR